MPGYEDIFNIIYIKLKINAHETLIRVLIYNLFSSAKDTKA
ncbi:hypothetical protein [Clostridium chauvoei]|nr:hypothetical protein [Clostridium chauvoei]